MNCMTTNTINKTHLRPTQLEWQNHYLKELIEEKYLLKSPRHYNIQGQHIDVTDNLEI